MSLSALEQYDEFAARHLGPSPDEQAAMLAALGVASLDALMDQTVPAAIRLPREAPFFELPAPRPEHEALAALKAVAAKNTPARSFIGLGYYGTRMPSVILRNVLENPGWYTAYTPYQAEIAQGRLEALLNFQRMVASLTGLPIANASLLDEATAAAEAMAMARRIARSSSSRFFVDAGVFPQTLDVLRTRAAYFGFELVVAPPEAAEGEFFGALLQNPDQKGEVRDLTAPLADLRARGAVVAVACDLMAQTLILSPGAMGADIALGSCQRFGLPMGLGGPHAAFFATRENHVRSMPGRIIGVSRDVRGRPALRMALQTREQHIRREKANSNLCTSQVLLANLAGMYAVWHGPEGLKNIARRIHRLTGILAEGLRAAGVPVLTHCAFDTLWIGTGKSLPGMNFRPVSEGVQGISLDETTTRAEVTALLVALTGQTPDINSLDARAAAREPLSPLLRGDAILTHPVFHRHRNEHALLRYLKSLQNKDLALDHAMIPLGSCTMKLTAACQMIPVTWPEFADPHPFAPPDQTRGYREMIDTLAAWLAAITGFDAVSLQPNSGAQGEYAGLVAIRRYHESRGEHGRNCCLIPQSAHGTNPASAKMCGMDIVAVACDEGGNIDLADLAAKAEQHASRLACLMITYPSTHGVFEASVREICNIIHRYGGQVYMDGANLNAQVGLTAPGHIGADVSHMNLHKTFALPHGGGGPGMGPIGVKAHLIPFLPGHVLEKSPRAEGVGTDEAAWAVSAAPFGSASILPIAWMYIALLGPAGLKRATQTAILNANYLARRLQPHYPVLYTGQNGRLAHECIFDIRPLKAATGITETDIAKRLMDYGFHAPTVSFPVAGTMMVEPTESESQAELDRFIDAMTQIREEIRKVETGAWPHDDNPLKNAPHTQADLADAEWHHPYSRAEAVFPLPWIETHKFWPSVNRIDEVYGDRTLGPV